MSKTTPPPPADLRGPFDELDVAERLVAMKDKLQISTAALCDVLGWSDASWSDKKLCKTAWTVTQVSAVVAAFQRLKPGWKRPPGFPWENADTERLLRKLDAIKTIFDEDIDDLH